MVTAAQSAQRELGACWGNPADHGLERFAPVKLSSTDCQFERALREKVVGKISVEALVDL